jgi:hypothetical protein
MPLCDESGQWALTLLRALISPSFNRINKFKNSTVSGLDVARRAAALQSF